MGEWMAGEICKIVYIHGFCEYLSNGPIKSHSSIGLFRCVYRISISALEACCEVNAAFGKMRYNANGKVLTQTYTRTHTWI